jgi:hypothetical protein
MPQMQLPALQILVAEAVAAVTQLLLLEMAAQAALAL